MQAIGVLAQEQIPVDLPEEVDAIIEQLSPFGLVNVTEIDRTKPFTHLCYSIDKPIPVNKISHAIEHNQVIMEQRGEETRRAAAIKTNDFLDHQLRDSDLPNLKVLEMTIEEKKPKFGAEFPSVTKFFRQGKERGDGIRVARDDGAGPPRAPRRRA